MKIATPAGSSYALTAHPPSFEGAASAVGAASSASTKSSRVIGALFASATSLLLFQRRAQTSSRAAQGGFELGDARMGGEQALAIERNENAVANET